MTDGDLVEDWPGAELLEEERRLDRLAEFDARLKECERIGVDFKAPPRDRKPQQELQPREPSVRLKTSGAGYS